jgi:hypothetical protein
MASARLQHGVINLHTLALAVWHYAPVYIEREQVIHSFTAGYGRHGQHKQHAKEKSDLCKLELGKFHARRALLGFFLRSGWWIIRG